MKNGGDWKSSLGLITTLAIQSDLTTFRGGSARDKREEKMGTRYSET
jgi:hypothetical protein